MIVVDTTVVNAALPALARALGGSLAGLEWVVNGYTLVFAGLLLTAGALGDRFGARRVFLGGLALFTAASVLCGLAPSLDALVAARAVQGAGAAALMPTSLALIAHAYPDPAARARAVGVWGGMSGLGIAVGPVAGGVLVDTLGWPSVFLVNVPVGLLALVLTARYAAPVPPTAAVRARGFDPAGQALGALALGALAYALIEGPHAGWRAPAVLAGAGLALGAGVLFVVVERRGRHPMVPPALLAARPVAAATAVGAALNFGLYGLLFALSLHLQRVLGYSALRTGLAFLPLTLAIATAVVQSGRLTARVGPRRPMLGGLAAAAAGAALLGLLGGPGASLGAGLGFVLLGFGIGLTMPAMTSVVIAGAPAGQTGVAAAVLSASRQAGGVLGVAVLGALVIGAAARPPAHAATPGVRVALALVAVLFAASGVLTARVIRADHAR